MHGRELRIQRKRNKARRNLDSMFDEYPKNSMIVQIQINTYSKNFGYDQYLQSYMKRMELRSGT